MGLNPADDAAVSRVAPGFALVQTLHFVPSVVHDPYALGAISANAMTNEAQIDGLPVYAIQYTRSSPKQATTSVSTSTTGWENTLATSRYTA